ncbi:MAG: hypothetical protein ACI4U5_00825 [Bacilli bacterium]
MQNKNLVTAIAGGVISLGGLIVSLVFYIKSFYFEDYGEWGKEFTANDYFLSLMIVSSILLVYFIYLLYKTVKKQTPADISHYIYLCASMILSFYSLGTFIKPWMKALSKHTQFDFISNQVYLYVGIIALIPTIYFAIVSVKKYLSKTNK